MFKLNSNPYSYSMISLFASIGFCLTLTIGVASSEFGLEFATRLDDGAQFEDDNQGQGVENPPANIDDGTGDQDEDWLEAESGATECGSYKEWKSSRSMTRGGHNASNRIANGYSVGAGWVPSFVFLVFQSGNRRAICGGTIITSRHILTAAHCLLGGLRRPRIKAYAGITQIGDQEDTYEVEKVCVPTSELGERGGFPALDLALLRTDRPISYSDRVQPVCLPKGAIQPDETAFVVGLGLIANKPREIKATKVQALALKRTTCPRGGGEFAVNKFSLCYGSQTGQPCQGDSGGPLYGFAEGKQYLLGLVSWGRADCVPNEPSSTVFTDMARAYSYLKESSKTCR